jgi:hypothetical protein
MINSLDKVMGSKPVYMPLSSFQDVTLVFVYNLDERHE